MLLCEAASLRSTSNKSEKTDKATPAGRVGVHCGPALAIA